MPLLAATARGSQVGYLERAGTILVLIFISPSSSPCREAHPRYLAVIEGSNVTADYGGFRIEILQKDRNAASCRRRSVQE